MKRRVLFIFVDALGPLQYERFGSSLSHMTCKRELNGILGYTSGALPTILTGEQPSGHGRACLFSRCESEDSLLAPLSWMGLLPKIVHERPRVRNWATSWLKKKRGLTGYVALHKVPPSLFRHLDLPERDDLFQTNEIGGAPTFLAAARDAGMSVFAAPWQVPEKQRWQLVHEELKDNAPDLTFLYASELDAVLHKEGNNGDQAGDTIARIAANINRARDALSAKGGELHTLIVGDHGMGEIHTTIDPRKLVATLTPGQVFVDATMMRVWGDKKKLDKIERKVQAEGWPGQFLNQAALQQENFPTRGAPYGDAIFVLNEGAMFAPSFLGGACAGMHGYTMESQSQNSVVVSDSPLPPQINSLGDLAPHVLKLLELGSQADHKPRESSPITLEKKLRKIA
jgi:hypothetical protein